MKRRVITTIAIVLALLGALAMPTIPNYRSIDSDTPDTSRPG